MWNMHVWKNKLPKNRQAAHPVSTQTEQIYNLQLNKIEL